MFEVHIMLWWGWGVGGSGGELNMQCERGQLGSSAIQLGCLLMCIY